MKFAAVAIAAVVVPSATAVAQPADGKVMIAPLDGSVKAHPDLADELTGVLIAAAVDAEVEHARGAIGLDELALMSGCSVDDRECRETLLATLQAESIIAGSISDDGGAVEVTLVRIAPDASVSTDRHPLSGSTKAELVASFEPIAASVFGGDPVPEPEPEPEPAPEPTPEPVAPPAAVSAGVDDDRIAGIRPWTLGLIGTGAALTASGLITLVLAGNVQGDIDSAPTSTAADLEALEDLEAKGRFRYRLSYGLLAAGGVSLAAGITLAVLQRDSSSRRIAVVKSGDGYAAVFGGSF